VIPSFESDKDTLNPGEHALLTYEVKYADEANIDWWLVLELDESADYDSGTVAYPYDKLSPGPNNVCLHASNTSGDVDVYCLGLTAASPAPPPPEIITFEADKYTLSPSEHATLNYEVMNATEVYLNDVEFDTDEGSAYDSGMHLVFYDDLSASSNQFCLNVSNGLDSVGECLWIEKQSAPSTIVLNNNSGSAICFVLISPTTSDDWGDDWLNFDETVPPGGRRTFTLSSGTYDMRALDCDENELSTLWDVEISGTFNIWNVP
jgi:hypothetical protein